MENMDRYTAFLGMKANRDRREALAKLLDSTQKHPYVIFGSKKGHVGNFYDKDKKRVGGAFSMMGTPEDIDLLSLCKRSIQMEIEKLDKEFNDIKV